MHRGRSWKIRVAHCDDCDPLHEKVEPDDVQHVLQICRHVTLTMLAIAAPQLGRRHGCKPEQIRIVPGDDCDPLYELMEPSVEKYWDRVKNEKYNTLWHVHWTAGDVPREDDVLTYKEVVSLVRA